MRTGLALEGYFCEREFFQHGDILRKQLERSLEPQGERSLGPLKQLCCGASSSFLLATADQVFTHDIVLEFLNSLRRWAKEELDAHHVSTPQIQVYLDSNRRELVPDSVPARWHYLYSLTSVQTPNLQILTEDASPKTWFGISIGRMISVRLGFNHLLVHEARQPYMLRGPKHAKEPLKGVILLHGYLW